MESLLAVTRVVSFDLVGQFRMPCALADGLDYYLQLQILCALPIAAALVMCGLFFGGFMLHARFKMRQTRRRRRAGAALRRMRAANELNLVTAEERRAGRHALRARHERDDEEIEARCRARLKERRERGVQHLVGLVCVAVDMLYPSVTRAVFQIFRCRRVGEAGWWLEARPQLFCILQLGPTGSYTGIQTEPSHRISQPRCPGCQCLRRASMRQRKPTKQADYSTRCFDDRWTAFLVLAIPCAVVYALGLPLLLCAVIRKYKREGRLDDEDVRRMVGWLHEPFRPVQAIAPQLIR